MAELYLKHDAGNDAKRHVIFVHGLDGHFEKTWQSFPGTLGFWPNWLGCDLPGVSIWSVGYNASKTLWLGGKAMHLVDRGLNVLKILLSEPSLQRGELILIGHSFGGLVIKQMLRSADSLALQKSEVSIFIKRIKKVAFLATPHNGSYLTFLCKLGLVRASLATTCLGMGDPNLLDLRDWYKSWSNTNCIEHLILRESEKTPLFFGFKISGIMIVGPVSADPGLNEICTPIDANHFNICKPDNRDSEIYRIIKDFILKNNTIQPSMITESKFDSIRDEVVEQPKITELMLNKINNLTCFPQHLVDQEIKKQLSIIQKSRLFNGFPIFDKANNLADDIIIGNLMGGSPQVKSYALAWCSRLQSCDTTIDKSVISFKKAKEFCGICEIEEIYVAEAFISAAKNNLPEALAKLMKNPTSLKYSAAFMIVNKYKGIESSLTWMSEAGIKFSDFDADGKASYLCNLLNMQQWELILENAKLIDNDELYDSPILMYLTAMANLITTVPIELRKDVSMEIPLNIRNFHLSADAESMKLRRKAKDIFLQCEKSARILECCDVADIASDYALWLELSDPETTQDGIIKLKESMTGNTEIVLRRFPIAFSYKIDINIEAIEDEVNRQTAKTLGNSRIAAVARLVLARSKEEPNKILQYIDNHRKQLDEFINKAWIYSLEIEALVKAGLIEEAKRRLNRIDRNELSEQEQKFLQNFIAAASSKDPLEIAITQYEKTCSINDLEQLLIILETSQHINLLHKYSEILFEKTKSPKSAERLASAKHRLGKYRDLYEFLSKNSEFVIHSKFLKLYWAWALFWQGKLADSKKELATLKNDMENNDIHDLEVNIAITSGDWESLATYIENEWNNRDKRSSKALLHVSKLAQAIQPNRAKDLILAAKEKGNDDPNILAAAYFSATSMGWENEPGVSNWLHEAAKLSGNDGPIQTISLEEISQNIPSRKEANYKILRNFNDGNIPVFLASNLLNRTLLDFYLFRAFSNDKEPDIRARTSIFAFSNMRPAFPIEGKVISIDRTALLTLGYLKILDVVFDNFKKIILPHSTMRWLFCEKQKIAFHQPSRIEEAEYLEKMIADKKIKAIIPDQIIDTDLALEVGNEFAFLLQEATKKSDNETRQKLVVCHYPIYKLGSFMHEAVDLTKYSGKLCSCSSVVKKLQECGILTEYAEKDALDYLAKHEQEWPEQVSIQDDAILYLDNLSLTFLQFTGLLEKITSANMEVYIHPAVIDESKFLTNHKSLSDKVDKLIDSIRESLTNAIASGKVELAAMPNREQQEKNENLYLINEMFLAAQKVDAFIIDDRYFNRHNIFDFNSDKISIHTTLDVLDFLESRKTINIEEKTEYRTSLRKAGYIFIPFAEEDLPYYLTRAQIVDGRLQETAELKAIRQGFLQLKLNNFIMLPRDLNWLIGILKNLSNFLKDQWIDVNKESICIARSDWLLQLIDYRGWSHCFDGITGANFAQCSAWVQVNSFLFGLDKEKASGMTLEKYWAWLEKKVIMPLKYEDPISYNALIKLLRDHISHLGKKTNVEENKFE